MGGNDPDPIGGTKATYERILGRFHFVLLRCRAVVSRQKDNQTRAIGLSRQPGWSYRQAAWST
eukprot:2836003-Prymnesium_polylepis.2